jgi:hypothetical protein
MKKIPPARPCAVESRCRSLLIPSKANPMLVRSMNEMTQTMIATGISRVQRDRPAGAGTAGTDAVAAIFSLLPIARRYTAYLSVSP